MMDAPNNTLTLAEHYVEMDQPQRALDALERSTNAEWERVAFWRIRSQALVNLDRFNDAADAARRGLQIDPHDIPLLALLAQCDTERGNLAAAERSLLAALQLAPDEPVLLCRYALVVARGGQFAKADQLLAEAARLAPEHPVVARTRVSLAYLRGDDRLAERESRALLAESPEDQYGNVMLGHALAEQGKVRSGTRMLRTAARSDPGNVRLVDAVRDVQHLGHWLLWPLWPLYRLGTAKFWLLGMSVFFGLRALGLAQAAGIAMLVYVAICVYSWIVPFVLKWWLRRRRF